MTPLEKERLLYQPRFPAVLKRGGYLKPSACSDDTITHELKNLFPIIGEAKRVTFVEGELGKEKPLKVGVFFSGGQAPGGHNVIAGLYDMLMTLSPKSELIGFLGGPSGLVNGKAVVLDKEKIAPFRNQGGFHLLGSGRTKIETDEQFELVRKVVEGMNLDGLVVIGGDDSNTNAAYLAEDFAKRQIDCTVIGVPKTIDGDLKTQDVEISFGFDTASKVYSELVGNLGKDLLSAKKMWAFVKLMGRSASHLTLECALNTQPNMALIGEAVEEQKKTVHQVVDEITDLVIARAKAGKPYGLILIPEGIIEFIPEFKRLIGHLNTLLAEGKGPEHLDEEGKKLFELLPKVFQEQLTLERDPHGNVQVSKIETERLFMKMVEEEIKRRGEKVPFSPQPFFFGYEARASLPTSFDANYCYSLGMVAALGVSLRTTGLMAALSDLHYPPEQWLPNLVPLVSMMGFEVRKGAQRGVVTKALVDLEGAMYNHYLKESPKWALDDQYLCPGPIQYFGPPSVTEILPWMIRVRV